MPVITSIEEARRLRDEANSRWIMAAMTGDGDAVLAAINDVERANAAEAELTPARIVTYRQCQELLLTIQNCRRNGTWRPINAKLNEFPGSPETLTIASEVRSIQFVGAYQTPLWEEAFELMEVAALALMANAEQRQDYVGSAA